MASSSSSCNYDVFLSFRGKDTRVSFTCHLYDALFKRKKIKTFIDDEELGRGDEISPALLNAIQGSNISVIIFSKDYASSKWCLNELVKILECKNMKGQIIIPVFYGVSPSDVRHQTGIFGDGFDKLEQQFKEKPEMVPKWRDALIETSHLAGHESTKFRNDALLVDKIVQDVLKNLEKISISTVSSNGLVGLNSRIELIKPFLCIESLDTVRVVGIWGMGGIGKTTLATAIFDQFSGEFDGKYFAKNVRRKSETGGGLEDLQKQILSTIVGEKLEVAGPNIPQFTKERVRRMKVFIVLDDVNKVGQLEGLIGGLDQFGPGSRIVVTTRDKGVLEKFGVGKIYRVVGLEGREAFELFCNYAFKENNCPEDLKGHSWRVVEYTKGNPLALKVLGSSLRQRSKTDWESVLDNVKGICSSGIYDIYGVLKISFNELTPKEKSAFLDIACFLEGEKKDIVMRIFDDSESCVLGVLTDKSLITISHNCLQMHDLLQEMGREIVRQESEEEPGKLSRLWDHKDVRHVLKHNKGTDKIKGMYFDLSNTKNIHLPSGAFKNMPNLRLLKFFVPEPIRVSIFATTKVHLEQGLEYLPKELRYLHWHQYPLKTLPLNFKPKNLFELNLSYSKVEKLWQGKKKAFKLKSIDLSYSPYLITLPDLSETPNLERLNLLHCTKLACVTSSIKKFSHLSMLCFKGCKSFKSFPSSLHFVSPATIDFSYCVNLKELPQISGNIRKLNLRETAIEAVPSSIERLTNLKTLDLRFCRRLKRVSTSIFKLESLIWLYLDGCLNLESFPEILEKMEHLNYIALERTETRELPSSVNNVEGLETLGLEGCSKLDNLPDSFGNLKYFEHIGAHGSAIVSQLPSYVANSNELKELSFRGCRGLVSFPTSLLSGSSPLVKLNLGDCALTAIPQEIGCLSSLEILWLTRNNFESLPASIKQLSRLRYLYLWNCNMLQSLPELPLSLKSLDASNCERLQRLPEISSCLEELVASVLGKLSKHSHENDFSMNEYSSMHEYSSSIEFWLTNCFKLDEEANNKHLVDSQLRIQQMAIASLKLFYELEDEERCELGGPTIILPGREIPEWFSNRSSGSEISLQLPHQYCCQNLIGFAFCAVLESGYRAWNGFHVGCRYSFEMDTLSERKHVRRGCSFSSFDRTKTEHVMLGFNPCGNIGFLDDNHHVTVYFEFFSESTVVKCCGVCPVYASPNETKPNTFTLNFATEIWKLDDKASTSGTSDEKELEPSPKRICRDQINTP